MDNGRISRIIPDLSDDTKIFKKSSSDDKENILDPSFLPNDLRLNTKTRLMWTELGKAAGIIDNTDNITNNNEVHSEENKIKLGDVSLNDNVENKQTALTNETRPMTSFKSSTKLQKMSNVIKNSTRLQSFNKNNNNRPILKISPTIVMPARASSFLYSQVLLPQNSFRSSTMGGIQDIQIYHETKEHFSCMIHPNSLFRKLWEILSAFAVLYVCAVTPLVLGFDYIDWSSISYFDSLFDAFFITDVILTFRTGIVANGEVIMDPKKVAKKYVASWFIYDFISNLPIELFVPSLKRKSLKFVKLQKIPKLLRFGRLLKYLREYAKYYNLALTFAATTLVLHISTCFWVLLYHECRDIITKKVICDESIKSMYVEALHIIIVMFLGNSDYSSFSSISKLRDPRTHSDASMHAFSTLIIVCGIISVAFLFGNIMTVLMSWDQKEAVFRNRMDIIKAEMKYYNIPAELQRRVRKNYDYLWINHRAYNDMSLLKQPGISVPLRTSIALHLYKDLLKQVPLFQNTTNKFMGKICMVLQTAVYLPSDIIIFENDIGREMFIIRKGRVEVLLSRSFNEKDSKNKIILEDGSFFGETALIMEVRRTNSVLAANICDLNVLDKRDFDEILAEYPEFGEKVSKIVIERQLDNMNIESPTVKKKIETQLKKVVHKSMHRKKMSASVRAVYNAKKLTDILRELGDKTVKSYTGKRNVSNRKISRNAILDSTSITGSSHRFDSGKSVTSTLGNTGKKLMNSSIEKSIDSIHSGTSSTEIIKNPIGLHSNETNDMYLLEKQTNSSNQKKETLNPSNTLKEIVQEKKNEKNPFILNVSDKNKRRHSSVTLSIKLLEKRNINNTNQTKIKKDNHTNDEKIEKNDESDNSEEGSIISNQSTLYHHNKRSSGQWIKRKNEEELYDEMNHISNEMKQMRFAMEKVNKLIDLLHIPNEKINIQNASIDENMIKQELDEMYTLNQEKIALSIKDNEIKKTNDIKIASKYKTLQWKKVSEL